MQFLFDVDPDAKNKERREAIREENRRIRDKRRQEEESEKARLREFKEKRAGMDPRRQGAQKHGTMPMDDVESKEADYQFPPKLRDLFELDDDDTEYNLPLKDTKALMDIFSELEEKSLNLIT